MSAEEANRIWTTLEAGNFDDFQPDEARASNMEEPNLADIQGDIRSPYNMRKRQAQAPSSSSSPTPLVLKKQKVEGRDPPDIQDVVVEGIKVGNGRLTGNGKLKPRLMCGHQGCLGK